MEPLRVFPAALRYTIHQLSIIATWRRLCDVSGQRARAVLQGLGTQPRPAEVAESGANRPEKHPNPNGVASPASPWKKDVQALSRHLHARHLRLRRRSRHHPRQLRDDSKAPLPRPRHPRPGRSILGSPASQAAGYRFPFRFFGFHFAIESASPLRQHPGRNLLRRRPRQRRLDPHQPSSPTTSCLDLLRAKGVSSEHEKVCEPRSPACSRRRSALPDRSTRSPITLDWLESQPPLT